MPRRANFTIERAYDEPTGGTYRVLVDRLWPRGVSKQRAAIDEWAKDITPSDALRRWYGHEPQKFAEFSKRYRAELASQPARDAVTALRKNAEKKAVTLVTATRDIEHSGAAVLLDVLTAPRAARIS